jgi:cytochrome c oxidase subunit 6b
MEMKNDEKVCGYFKHFYKDLCPEEWISKWDDQMERETFPGIHD